MKIYSTYCSAKKDENPELLPAIDRYISGRMIVVSSLSKSDKCPFFIFSGKYGMLQAEDEIPYYDHLLIEEEVREHAHLVATQLEHFGIKTIDFYTATIQEDPNLKPYHNCLKLACNTTGTRLNLIVIEITKE